MRNGTRMLMLAERDRMNYGENTYDREPQNTYRMGGYNQPNNAYDMGEMEYDNEVENAYTRNRMSINNGAYNGYDMPESRRYKNGRFAPKNGGYPEMHSGYNGDQHKMQMGFATGDNEGDWEDEEENEVMPFSQMTAQKWARSMENADGTMGAHWNIDQVQQLIARKNIKCDLWEFFAAINAIYSDYGKVLKKYGMGDKVDLYIDMAKAFIDDEDAQPDKLARYYQYVVKH